ncbi:hypothetical protein DQ04_19951010 [Trypanosoma grayi]|uniref:hypothetical protein n=1 Tax=Trypanosoma grayi TaxID=71804 RepID=UPI0004F4871F|nr:hypothetical protein DQ04_19951010 [Trypanosoma grayi]KEG05621.1 hypothetical protein DQ04_19951010 [Trypanosoma grayi]
MARKFPKPFRSLEPTCVASCCISLVVIAIVVGSILASPSQHTLLLTSLGHCCTYIFGLLVLFFCCLFIPEHDMYGFLNLGALFLISEAKRGSSAMACGVMIDVSGLTAPVGSVESG